MKRMNVVVMNRDRERGEEDATATAVETGSGKYECDSCRAEFPNKTSADRHALFCRTLAGIRRRPGGGGGSSGASVSTTIHNGVSSVDDPLMPTQREMFILIQELAAKYNKVKDELDVMKQWAKMVGRRIGGAGAGGGADSGGGSGLTGLDFTSITRQKRQNMEVILNEEDAEHPDLAGLRLGFAEWLSLSPTLWSLTETDLNVVFNEDLVAGITAAILRILSNYTVESGKSHLIPFKLADIKQGAFYIYDTPFKVGGTGMPTDTPENDLPPPPFYRKWRIMEPCEFQFLVRSFHKLLFQEFKKWQDKNWDAQQQITNQRKKAATSYHHVMSSLQCSPAMATCDGLSPVLCCDDEDVDDGVDGSSGSGGSSIILSEDFATLYNKYADKMMGGTLTDETILSRVRTKLWKDMKTWRL